MDGQFLPDDAINGKLEPAWRNFFENTALVQVSYANMFSRANVPLFGGVHLYNSL